MSWLWWVTMGLSVVYLGGALAALWVWLRRREVERACAICGATVAMEDPRGWRWSRHLDGPVCETCIPAWLRAADRTASLGCCRGRGYVQLWLDEGDGMRLLDQAAKSETA